jgi:hypothetical protein
MIPARRRREFFHHEEMKVAKRDQVYFSFASCSDRDKPF